MTPEADEIKTVASHGLAYLRTLDKKVDLVIESLQRQGERLARVERDLGETRRDLVEVKGDIALLENKEFNGREIVIERPDGTRATALAHVNPLRDFEGNLTGAVNVVVDISDL